MDTIYCPERKVDLFCGKPLIIFHDCDLVLLDHFCRFVPLVERCTRIVVNFDNHPKEIDRVIFADQQTEIEIATWYASADAVVTCEHSAEACMCGAHVFDDIAKLRKTLKI